MPPGVKRGSTSAPSGRTFKNDASLRNVQTGFGILLPRARLILFLVLHLPRRRVDQASLECVSGSLVLFPRFYLGEKSMSTDMLTRVYT